MKTEITNIELVFGKCYFMLRCIFIILTIIAAVDCIFWIRPFIEKSMRNRKPNHNFWPWIPVSHSKEKVPKHNFWPWIPVKPPDKDTGYKPPVAPERPKPSIPFPSNIKYNYDEVLDKSILFYEAQRSGRLPPFRRIKWRGNSALADKGLYGEDLSGGWYDAGDHMKYGFPMAASATVLIWGLLEYRESYETAGLFELMLDCIKWPLDYFIKAHTKQYEFYAQVGNTATDHAFWGRHEDMRMFRPPHRLTPKRPGSDVIAETAASLAAGSIVFNKTQHVYARSLLRHAMDLFGFANKHRGKYSDSIPGVKEYYRSSGFVDELVWAAIWLYMATGRQWYLNFAEKNYKNSEIWGFSWDDKEIASAVLLYRVTRKRIYKDDIVDYMESWMPGGSVTYTPKGLAYRDSWGVLSYAANMAFIALVAADTGIRPRPYRDWARSQIHYILGDSGRSYVVGFGKNPPKKPHHSTSSCRPRPYPCTWEDFYKDGPNSIVLYGAVVGGPDKYDKFVDDRSDYIHNEVACDYNSGFQSAVAGLKHLYLRTAFTGGNNNQTQRLNPYRRPGV